MKKKILISGLIIILMVFVFILVFEITNLNIKTSSKNVTNEVSNNNETSEEKKENDELQYLIAISSIKDYIPQNITSIERESYITGNKVTYPINNYKTFLKDILEIEWEETEEQVDDSYYYIVNIHGNKNCYIKIYKKFYNIPNSADIRGYAEVYNDNGETKRYTVPVNLYYTIHYYINENLDLYNSDLPLPTEEKCYAAQNDILKGLSDEDKITVQNNIRLIHSYLENIINEKELNDSTSQEWVIETSENEITYQDLLGTKIMEYYGVLKNNYKTFVSTINMLEDSDGKQSLLEAANLYNEAMEEHSVLKLYNSYKIIHDYDFFVLNYPPYWNLPAGQNYAGIDAYFGSVEALN